MRIVDKALSPGLQRTLMKKEPRRKRNAFMVLGTKRFLDALCGCVMCCCIYEVRLIFWRVHGRPFYSNSKKQQKQLCHSGIRIRVFQIIDHLEHKSTPYKGLECVIETFYGTSSKVKVAFPSGFLDNISISEEDPNNIGEIVLLLAYY